MKDILIKSFRFNLQYAHELVVDVKEEMMTITPAKGLENHPAFTLGHLASAAALTSKYLGGKYDFPSEWEDLFKRKGPGDPRLPELDSKRYPDKAQLLEKLSFYHKSVEDQIEDMKPSRFEELVKWRYHERMPTLGDLLYFMCITHESMHLGQLAAWRRAMGLNSALARL